jgi:hypothetical protein
MSLLNRMSPVRASTVTAANLAASAIADVMNTAVTKTANDKTQLRKIPAPFAIIIPNPFCWPISGAGRLTKVSENAKKFHVRPYQPVKTKNMAILNALSVAYPGLCCDAK